jgi:uncharacterized protein
MINLSSYQLSKFNVSTTDREGNLLLTNTISNVLIKIINNKNVPITPFEINIDLFTHIDQQVLEEFLKYGVLVEKGKNEEKQIDQIYNNVVENNKRLDIVILTTNQCNFSCVYCFQKREPHFLNFKQYDALLSFIETKIKEHGYLIKKGYTIFLKRLMNYENAIILHTVVELSQMVIY